MFKIKVLLIKLQQYVYDTVDLCPYSADTL